jgi:hypothetical protein
LVEDTKELKLSAIAANIKAIKADRYRAEVSLISEKTLSTGYLEMISFLENEISSYSNQIAALEAQYASIESE